MSSRVVTQYPGFRDDLKKLIQEHRQIKDEPLLLAIYYAPPRDADDVFLFEVISNFGTGQLDSDGNLFEVTYGSRSEFPMSPEQRLHLVLTNPTELELALEENWALADEVRSALRTGKAQVLYQDPDQGKNLLDMIRG